MWWWMGTCTIHVRIMVSQVHLAHLKFSSQFWTFHNLIITLSKNDCYSQPLTLGKELPKAQTTDLPCLLWAETSITQTSHIFTGITSSEVTTQSWSRWKSLILHRSLTKQEPCSTSEHFPGWVIAFQPSSVVTAPCDPVPSGSRSICSSRARLPTPGQQQPEAEVRTKLCFCRGEGHSPSTVAPLIWMLTYLLQVTFVISHGMQTSDNTGRERGALRLRRKCIFSTSHQPNYQLLSFAKSFNYAYSSKSESV